MNDVKVLESQVQSIEARMLELKNSLGAKTGSVEDIKKLEDEISLKISSKVYKTSKEVELDMKKLKVLKSGRSYNYVKGINKGVGAFVYSLMAGGEKDDRKIWELVCKKYENENSSISCIRWYRNKFNKGEM